METLAYYFTHNATGLDYISQDTSETKARNRAFRRLFPSESLDGVKTRKADWTLHKVEDWSRD